MNKKLKSLVKKVILGATAALSTSSIFASPKYDDLKIPINPKQAELVLPNFNKESDIPNLVLQSPSQNNPETNLFHASHSSHASHASHASHYSSYTSPNNIPPSNDNDKQDAIIKQTPAYQTQKTDNEMIYKLGSRILSKNMKGTDVAELQDLLFAKGFKVKITGTFDEITEKAVENFQKAEKIEVTGKVDVLTYYYLNK